MLTTHLWNPLAPAHIALHPHDPRTGEEIGREEVVKGYEYERGRFVTFTAEELKALDVESSKIIDLETFVPRAEVDPVCLNVPYYVYPDGPIATETFGVIGAAMGEAGTVGIGRVTWAGASGSSWSSRAARAWWRSPCGRQRRCECPPLQRLTRRPMPIWSRSRRRLSSVAAGISTRQPSGTAIRRHCAS